MTEASYLVKLEECDKEIDGKLYIGTMGDKTKSLFFEDDQNSAERIDDQEAEPGFDMVGKHEKPKLFSNLTDLKQSESVLTFNCNDNNIKIIFMSADEASDFMWKWNYDDNLISFSSYYRDIMTSFGGVTDRVNSIYNHFFRPVKLAKKCHCSRGSPVTREIWNNYFDEKGIIKNEEDLKKMVFRGGFSDDLRADGWRYLLEMYSYTSTFNDRAQEKVIKSNEYVKKKEESYLKCQTDRTLKAQKILIEKDVRRTDRDQPYYAIEANIDVLRDILLTYVFSFGSELGFVQGMPDLLSPLLFLLQNEAEAFWAFVQLMRKLKLNFEFDQAETKKQLRELSVLLEVIDENFFTSLSKISHDIFNLCFRWIIVSFRREFNFTDIQLLWDVLLTELPSPNFHLFICLAMILKIRRKDDFVTYEDVLVCLNQLSMNMNVSEIICEAEALFLQLHASEHLPENICRLLGKKFEKEDFFSSPLLSFFI